VTGLIYLVIIALWAAVLIPIWLRRHDQISEVRSTARFSSAMRSLGGPGTLATEPAIPADRPSRPAARPSRAEVRMRPTERPAEGLDPSYERELARQAAATRRAIVLGALTAILLVVLLLAIAGIVARWAPIVAAVPVIAFVVAAALTAKERTPARASRRPARPRPARVEEAAPAAAAPRIEDDWETWNAWDDDDAWEAVPTTLPTYVSAPRASAMPRSIERDGDWSGEAMIRTARSMQATPAQSADRPQSRALDHSADTAEIPAIAVNE
jgi:hypothetical protein